MKNKTICVLILFVVFSLGAISFASRKPSPRQTTETAIDTCFYALSAFKKVCGRYPTTHEGLKALREKPPNLICKNEEFLREWIMDPVFLRPIDGWGEDLKYKSNGKSYTIKASHGYPMSDSDPDGECKNQPKPVPPASGCQNACIHGKWDTACF